MDPLRKDEERRNRLDLSFKNFLHIGCILEVVGTMTIPGDSGKEVDLGKIIDTGEEERKKVLGEKPPRRGRALTPMHEYDIPTVSPTGTTKPDYHDVHPARKDVKG